jgi:O-antigen ligase
LAVIVIGWVVLPQEFREAFMDRFSESDDVRLYLWQYYLNVAMSNPLGIGFNYEQIFVPGDPYSSIRLNPHNAWLAALMYGGVGGLLSMMMTLITILKLIRIELIKSRQQGDIPVLYIGSAVPLLSMWVFFMFVGGVPLAEFTYSILLALVLAGRIKPSENPIPHIGIHRVQSL